jgi:acyl transferase domain-containing protein
LLRGQEREVAIAGVNGPAHTVISGRACVVETILSKLADDGIEWQRLNVSHAFHSPLMDPMLHEFECLALQVEYSPANIGIVSNVTGRMAGAEIATAAYWRRHARDAVRFSDGIATLHAEKIRTFLEVGPSPTLLRMAQRCPRADEALWLPSLRKDRGDSESMLASLGDLWVRGQRIDWGALAGPGARRVELPTYPFQRERYWHDLAAHGRAQTPAGRDSGHPLLGHRLASPLVVYQSTISVAEMPWLADHRVYDLTLFPATGFLELALAAARHSSGDERIVLDNLSIHQGLVLPSQGAVTVQVIVTPGAGGGHKVEVFSAEVTSAADADWRRHVSATTARADGSDSRRLAHRRA